MHDNMGTLNVEGKEFIIIPRDEYHRLKTLAKAAELPPLPEPDDEGNYPAVAYSQASIARKLLRDRVELGLTQKELAKRAGIRFETLCRLEKAERFPSIRTIKRLDAALKASRKRK